MTKRNFGTVLALLIVAAVWLAHRERGVAPAPVELAPAEHAAPLVEPTPDLASVAGDPAIPAVAERGGGQGGASDVDVDLRHVPGAHPHPITEEHRRIFRENALVGAMDGAMDVNDGPGLAALLDRYRQEYPDDPNLLQDGYQVIADCLQHPGAGSTALGRAYVERERGSILRRFVERHCLGQ